jgi:hypothetical protein
VLCPVRSIMPCSLKTPQAVNQAEEQPTHQEPCSLYHYLLAHSWCTGTPITHVSCLLSSFFCCGQREPAISVSMCGISAFKCFRQWVLREQSCYALCVTTGPRKCEWRCWTSQQENLQGVRPGSRERRKDYYVALCCIQYGMYSRLTLPRCVEGRPPPSQWITNR